MTTSVSVLGLGPMGRALASALHDAGHRTVVWNRTPGRAEGLGVPEARTAQEAIAASDLIIVCVVNYEAAVSVLDAQALKGRTLANLSGGSPSQARDMAVWAGDRGAAYIDGVIVATPDAIGGPDARLFYSGSRTSYEAHRDVLNALGPNATYLGEEPGGAASFDVALQDLFWTAMGGVVHALAYARAESISAGDFAVHANAMLSFFPDLVDQVATQASEGVFPGDDSSVASVAAVLDNLLEAIRSRNLDNGVLSAIRADVQRAIDAGFGSDGFARLTTLQGPARP